MWTEALCLRSHSKVWIPAESVYRPFVSSDYHCRSIFASSSNGRASGSSYLEATVHALYELLERHYLAHRWQPGCYIPVDISSLELKSKPLQKILRRALSEFGFEFYWVRLPNVQNDNLPCFCVRLPHDQQNYIGYGCYASLETAIFRALSECFQSWATTVSGGREDLAANNPSGLPGSAPSPNQLRSRHALKLDLLAVRAYCHDLRFANLREEFDFLAQWLSKQGYPDVYLSNLSRVGIDIPVVKAVVPGLKAGAALLTPGSDKAGIIPNLQFSVSEKPSCGQRGCD